MDRGVTFKSLTFQVALATGNLSNKRKLGLTPRRPARRLELTWPSSLQITKTLSFVKNTAGLDWDLKRANGFGWMALFLAIRTGVVISQIIIIAFYGTGPPVNGVMLTAVHCPGLIFVKRQLLKASSPR